jgi:hypothetical protein
MDVPGVNAGKLMESKRLICCLSALYGHVILIECDGLESDGRPVLVHVWVQNRREANRQ